MSIGVEVVSVNSGRVESMLNLLIAINLRRLWQQFVFDRLLMLYFLLKVQIDWIHATGNTITFLAQCKVLLLIENANPNSSIHFGSAFRNRISLRILGPVGYSSSEKGAVVMFPSEVARRNIVREDRNSMLKICVISQRDVLSELLTPERKRPAANTGPAPLFDR